MLWFGWFGFNAGSALASGQLTATVFMNTQVATATAALSWILVEKIRDGKPTTLGSRQAPSQVQLRLRPRVGLSPQWVRFWSALRRAICSLAVGLKYKFGYDDSLDVVGVHGVGGLVGMISIGLLATVSVNSAGADGLLYGGGAGLLGRQLIASGATLAYALIVTAVLAFIVEDSGAEDFTGKRVRRARYFRTCRECV